MCSAVSRTVITKFVDSINRIHVQTFRSILAADTKCEEGKFANPLILYSLRRCNKVMVQFSFTYSYSAWLAFCPTKQKLCSHCQT